MKAWKNYLKGIFDTKEIGQKILVTGSVRLNTLRQAGDSLAGRFFMHQLLPFSVAEIKDLKLNFDIERFMIRGGFPEPFLAKTEQDADRWKRQYFDGLVKTDILDFETVHNFRAVQMVLELLRRKVGSLISYTSIVEDVQISPMTVKKYIEIFEALFIVFRVPHIQKILLDQFLKSQKSIFLIMVLCLVMKEQNLKIL